MNAISQPLVSIIVTCYNLESLISQTLSSILNQTYTNLDVLVVDDCSSDESCLIIGQFIEKDSRVRLIRNNINKGALRTKLSGISSSFGDYFILCDGDDWIEPNLVEKCLEVIGNNDCVTFQFDSVDDITGNVRKCVLQSDILKKATQGFYLKPSELAKISHLMQIYFYSSRIKHDYLDIYENIPPIPYFEEIPGYLLTLCKYKVKIIPDILYHYRINRAGQTTASWFITNRPCKYQSLILAIEQSKSKDIWQNKVTHYTIFYKLINIALHDTVGTCKFNPNDYSNLKKVMTILFNDLDLRYEIDLEDVRLMTFYYCFRLLPVWLVLKVIAPSYKILRKLKK